MHNYPLTEWVCREVQGSPQSDGCGPSTTLQLFEDLTSIDVALLYAEMFCDARARIILEIKAPGCEWRRYRIDRTAAGEFSVQADGKPD